MPKDKSPPPKPPSPDTPGDDNTLLTWRERAKAMWPMMKITGITVGILGTLLGIYVDLQETSGILGKSVLTDDAEQAPDPTAVLIEASSTCGNGVTEEGEECDDGNTVHGDLCTPTCTSNLAKVAGGMLNRGFSKAELDGGMHLLSPSYLSPKDTRKKAEWATPATPVQIGPFWMMRTEVSWAAMSAFLDDDGAGSLTEVLQRLEAGDAPGQGHRGVKSLRWHRQAMTEARARYHPERGKRRGPPEKPAQVNLETAVAYCAWIGGHVPIEEQWELAARGPNGKRIYPWGDRPLTSSPEDCELVTAFFSMSMDPPLEFNCGGRETTPVGSLPAGCTPEGICDLAGNVDEWVIPGAVVWKEVTYKEWSSEPFVVAYPPGPLEGRLLRPCKSPGFNDPYGLVSGEVTDCVHAAGTTYSSAPTKRYPASRTLRVLRGGNHHNSNPVFYQGRARFPFARHPLSKGVRCSFKKQSFPDGGDTAR